jgi:hypothetical protein
MPLYDQVELLCQAINTQAQEETILTQARVEADRRLSEAGARCQETLARIRAQVEARARLLAFRETPDYRDWLRAETARQFWGTGAG